MKASIANSTAEGHVALLVKGNSSFLTLTMLENSAINHNKVR